MAAAPERIVLGSDHAGVDLKAGIRAALEEDGYRVEDLGPQDASSVDYPEYAEAVANRVAAGSADLGILVCGTGIGMTIAANKVPGIRAALLYDDTAARYARLHNDANVLVFGARTMSLPDVLGRIRLFLRESFEGGRHAGRLAGIHRIEQRREAPAVEGAHGCPT
ncbi:MAG: ribose 5-phosphate isomerase B [Deltaproteobacteria bacterium]